MQAMLVSSANPMAATCIQQLSKCMGGSMYREQSNGLLYLKMLTSYQKAATGKQLDCKIYSHSPHEMALLRLHAILAGGKVENEEFCLAVC